MGRRLEEPQKPMVCFDCGMKIRATLQQAKRHGWTLWVGGSRCKSCSEALAREKP